MELQGVNKVHNFGIYRKGGKRCIFQLDFPGRMLLVIQKGRIKKSHPMSALDHYDSEDGLHICMKLRDGEMVFEADNMEEKCTICCLLGLVMQIGQEGDEDSIDSGHGHGFLSDHHLDNTDVIKDGLLEKKGHTTITTWNKRRIRLVPGELSYFKPGEELALNVIQLWKDKCLLKKQQHNGFTLTIRSRVYSFRTLHDYKATHMTEIARDDWYEAFERAMSLPPATSKILDMNMFPGGINMRHNDTRSSIDSNASNRSSRSSSSSSSTYSSKNKREPLYDTTPDILEKFMASPDQYTAPVPKSLRGNTLPSAQTRAPPMTTTIEEKYGLAFLRRSQSSENLLDSSTHPGSNPNRQSREFHGLSPLSKGKLSKKPSLSTSASTSDLLDGEKEDVFSGTAAAYRAKLVEKGGKSSSLKNYRANKELKASKMEGVKRGVCKAYNMFLIGADFRARSLDRNHPRLPPQVHPIIDIPEKMTALRQESEIYSEAKPSLDIVRPTLEDSSELTTDFTTKTTDFTTKTTDFTTKTTDFTTKTTDFTTKTTDFTTKELSTFSSPTLMPSTEAATLLIRGTPTCNDPDSLTVESRETSPLPVAPTPSSRLGKNRTKDKPSVPPPPPPSLFPPPPPPPRSSDTEDNHQQKQAVPHGLKLKQIHWTKVSQNQISASLWKDVSDVTENLDLVELEEQFAVVSSKSALAKTNNQPEKQMLVDAKRAQNLGILFNGLKLDSIHKLLEALNSTTELESFPVDKLATLKRFQPTTEELEMYRDHANKQDSLHDVDKFMVELCQISKLGLRLDMCLTLCEFPGQCAGLEEELIDILAASEQLLDSTSLARVLEYILAIGNVMNSSWGVKPDARGFQLSSLDKIMDVKGRDTKATLCGYLVRQLQRNDPSLLAWPDSVDGVNKCAGYSVKAVGAEIDVLKNDLHKIKRTLKVLRHLPSLDRGFLLDVQNFIVEHDRRIDQLEIKYITVTDKYKELMVRFGEPAINTSESIFSIVSGFIDKFNQAKLEQDP